MFRPKVHHEKEVPFLRLESLRIDFCQTAKNLLTESNVLSSASSPNNWGVHFRDCPYPLADPLKALQEYYLDTRRNLRVGKIKNKTPRFEKLSAKKLKKRGRIPILNQNGKSTTRCVGEGKPLTVVGNMFFDSLDLNRAERDAIGSRTMGTEGP